MDISRRKFLQSAATTAISFSATGLLGGVSAHADSPIENEATQTLQKPMMAIQQIMLGSITDTEQNALDVLSAVKEAGYQAIELNDFMIHPTSLSIKLMTQLAGMPIGNGGKLDWPSLITQSGLKVPSIHQYLDAMENDPDSVVAECETFGAKKVVLTGMYRYDYSTTDSVLNLSNRLNAAGQQLADSGIELLYHNHNCEFLRLEDGSSAYHLLQDSTNPDYVGFELDSYWCAECGADPILEMQRLGNRLKMHHINDRGTRQKGASPTPILTSNAMELGTGTMPLKELLEIDKSVGVTAVVLETHQNWIDKSPVKSLQLSADFLKRNL